MAARSCWTRLGARGSSRQTASRSASPSRRLTSRKASRPPSEDSCPPSKRAIRAGQRPVIGRAAAAQMQPWRVWAPEPAGFECRNRILLPRSGLRHVRQLSCIKWPSRRGNAKMSFFKRHAMSSLRAKAVAPSRRQLLALGCACCLTAALPVSPAAAQSEAVQRHLAAARQAAGEDLRA